MRITVTLEPDVVRIVRDRMKRTRVSFNEALNDAIRAGTAPVRRFEQQSFSLGSVQKFRWDKALAVADALEDEGITRTLS